MKILCKILEISLLLLLVLWAMVLLTSNVCAQSGPVMRHNDTLRVYIGASEPAGVRIFVGTTWSVSPNADIGYPFDQVGENPDKVYWSKYVRVIAPNDLCHTIKIIPCRDTGFVDLPVPDVKIEVPYGSRNWVHDRDMRIVIHVAEVHMGVCSVASCGARLVVPRMKLSDVLPVPTVVDLREIIP